VIHHTGPSTVWFDDPSKESVSEETADEVVLMKDDVGRVIGLLSFTGVVGLAVETVVRSES
jgi:hypothetical protein